MRRYLFSYAGWKRFGIKVAEDSKEFDSRWENWCVAYHGTAGENASKTRARSQNFGKGGAQYYRCKQL